MMIGLTSLEGQITQALWVAGLFACRRASQKKEPHAELRVNEWLLWCALGSNPLPMTGG